ncbi:MAG: hypothetical protein ACXAC5_01860 [Promethearchaeota archaeon]|jgi:hypothetical protein
MMAKSRTSTEAKSKGSAASVLGQLGKKPAASSKSKTPVVTVTNQAQLAAMKAIADAKNAQKAAVSALKVAEGGFRDNACEYYETRCREDGTLHTSIKLVGRLEPDKGEPEALSLSYTQTRRCGKMVEAEASDPLHAVFGDEFDNLFAPSRTIEIDTSVLNDDQVVKLVAAMQKALEDSFDDAVTVESLIVPKEAFFGKRILDDNIRKLAARAVADGYAVPFTASFKA